MTARASRPFIFLAVGALNTLLDFLFYTFLVFTFFPESRDIWIVGVISGVAALILAYTTHQLITWRDHPASKLTIVKFVIVTGIGLWIIRPILLLWFIGFSGLYSSLCTLVEPFGLSYDFTTSTGAFILMVIVVMIYNFLAYDKFVFTEKTHTEQRNGLKS